MFVARYRTTSLTLALVAIVLAGCRPDVKDQEAQPPASATNTSPIAVTARKRLKRDVATTSQREATDSTNEQQLQNQPPEGSQDTTVDTRQLVARLVATSINNGAVTPEQAAEVNQMLSQLGAQGVAALPAIRDFLLRNEDVSFQGVPGGEAVGFGSLRLGVIDVLTRIGGEQAVELGAQALQSSVDPQEIAALANMVEQNAPNQYHTQVSAAASASLMQALNGRLSNRDVTPLFEILQTMGDASVVPALKQSVGQWSYRATVALAGLPDGAGIPALISLARDASVTAMGNGDVALRPLAQVAVQYPEAAKALVDQARLGAIPETAWPPVIASLTGVATEYGGGLSAPMANPSAAEMTQQIAILNQLLIVTKDPQIQAELQNAIAGVSAKLPK
jgi:hypothetical protein